MSVTNEQNLETESIVQEHLKNSLETFDDFEHALETASNSRSASVCLYFPPLNYLHADLIPIAGHRVQC
ncbi:hypothetical protein OCU04_000719 [Sclerotinia nivalis]|uniref:Uncharacterized protein n=1 Tax=Sclerotinia nivalis TaxID=352851 RepID=A0A9X0DP13_9HELO|nr:hypothetical protein OCU04_000719 [Sclerotinia nivalis]